MRLRLLAPLAALAVAPLAALAVAPAAAQALVAPDPAPPPRYATLGRDGLWLHDPAVVQRLAGPGEVDTFGFDRDGAAVLVTSGRELARVTLDGRRREVLWTAPGEVRFPDASPRDGAIVCAEDVGAKPGEQRWQVTLVGADGRGARRLADGYDPCFTPCGRYVVFEATSDDTTDLFVLDLDAQGAESPAPRRLLAPSEASRHTPYVAPDGRLVWFSSGGSLHAAPMLAEGPAAAMTPPGAYDRFVTASPDGATLLFFRQAEGQDLLVLRAADGAEHHARGSGARLAAFAPAPPSRDSVAARVRALRGDTLALAGVTALSPTDARHVAAARGLRRLELPQLTQLDAATASELARAPLSALVIPAGAALADGAHEALAAARIDLVDSGG